LCNLNAAGHTCVMTMPRGARKAGHAQQRRAGHTAATNRSAMHRCV